MTRNSGGRANRSGSTLETQVQSSVQSWLSVSVGPFKDSLRRPFLKKNAPYDTVYKTVGRTEFLLGLEGGRDVRIECKWQHVSGSVDEKYPYMFINMANVKEGEVIIVVDGGGQKAEAIAWLRKACMEDGFSHGSVSLRKAEVPVMRVMDLREFMCWVQSGAPHLSTVK